MNDNTLALSERYTSLALPSPNPSMHFFQYIEHKYPDEDVTFKPHKWSWALLLSILMCVALLTPGLQEFVNDVAYALTGMPHVGENITYIVTILLVIWLFAYSPVCDAHNRQANWYFNKNLRRAIRLSPTGLGLVGLGLESYISTYGKGVLKDALATVEGLTFEVTDNDQGERVCLLRGMNDEALEKWREFCVVNRQRGFAQTVCVEAFGAFVKSAQSSQQQHRDWMSGDRMTTALRQGGK